MVELAGTDPNRCAILCANLGGDTDTIGAMATAMRRATRVSAIDPALKPLDVNQLDFTRYADALLHYREQREAYECPTVNDKLATLRRTPGHGAGRRGD
jgi:hypothetical protein